MVDRLTLRPIVVDDETFLFEVYASTRATELLAVGWDEGQKTSFLRMQFAAQRQYYLEQFPGAAFDVILLDGEPAGRLYVERAPTEIRIIDIALLPAHRHKGVGTRLIADIQREAAVHGKPLRIHVERFNPALHWYQRLGFAAIADRGVYLLMEWRDATAQR